MLTTRNTNFGSNITSTNVIAKQSKGFLYLTRVKVYVSQVSFSKSLVSVGKVLSWLSGVVESFTNIEKLSNFFHESYLYYM